MVDPLYECPYDFNPTFTTEANLNTYFNYNDPTFNFYDPSNTSNVLEVVDVNPREIMISSELADEDERYDYYDPKTTSYTRKFSSPFDLLYCTTAINYHSYWQVKQDMGWDLSASGVLTRPAWIISTYITYNELKNTPYFTLYPLPNKQITGVDMTKSHFHNLTITGPKTVFILIDLSYSFENKIALVKDAAKQVIDTLSEFDYAMVIGFNVTAAPEDTVLLPMTYANKTVLKDYVDLATFEPAGKSDLDVAITETFTIIEASQPYGVGCPNSGAILIISDWQDLTYTTATISTLNKYRRFKVFQFSVDNYLTLGNANKDIACETGGAAWVMDDTTELTLVINQWIKYLALGMYSETIRHTLVEDPITHQTSYKLCKPLNQYSDDRIYSITGSSCVDTNIFTDKSTLEGYSDFSTEFGTTLTDQTKLCPDFYMSEVEMNEARLLLDALTCSYSSYSTFNTTPNSTTLYGTFDTDFDNVVTLLEEDISAIDYQNCGSINTSQYHNGADKFYEEVGFTTFDSTSTDYNQWMKCISWIIHADILDLYRTYNYYDSLGSSSNTDGDASLKLIHQKGPMLTSPIRSDVTLVDLRDEIESIFTFTGPKDIIFAIESSAYMDQQPGLAEEIPLYMIKVMEILTEYDRINIVAIDSAADTWNSSMVYATAANKALLLDFYETLRFTSTTPDFVSAFTSILSIISASSTNFCKGHILFLQASVQGTTISSDIDSFHSSLDSNYRLHTITLGKCNMNKYYAKYMSCPANGMLFKADQVTDLLTFARKFYKIDRKGTTKRIFRTYTNSTITEITQCTPTNNQMAITCIDMSFMLPIATLIAKSDFSTLDASFDTLNEACPSTFLTSSDSEFIDIQQEYTDFDCDETVTVPTNTDCILCNANQFINNNNVCINKSIENCYIYDPDSVSGSVLCKVCRNDTVSSFSQSTKVLSIDYTQCLDFIAIPNCSVYEFNSQKCQTCDTNYFLTNNNSCVEDRIKDCNSYDLINSYPGRPICTGCVETMHVVNNACVPCDENEFMDLNNNCIPRHASYNNCAIWDLQSNVYTAKCDVCEKGYFRNKRDRCVPMDSIENCIIFDYASSTPGYEQCFKCVHNQIFNNITDQCECPSDTFMTNEHYCPDKIYPNCKRWSDESTMSNPICLECETNYYLSQQGECEIYTAWAETYWHTEYNQDKNLSVEFDVVQANFEAILPKMEQYIAKILEMMWYFIVAFAILTTFCCLCWSEWWRFIKDKPRKTIVIPRRPITPEPSEQPLIEEEPEPEPEKEPTIRYLYDVEDADSMIQMRAKVMDIMRPWATGDPPKMTGVKFNKSYRQVQDELHYNIGTDPFISFMLLDSMGDGIIEFEDAANYVMDNIQLNSNILLHIPEDYVCDPADMCDVRRDLLNRKMEKLKEDFILNLFNQMDKFNERKVIRTEFEQWFIIKMPKMNAHDRMKCLGMLCTKFKEKDTKNKGYLKFEEFRLMRDYILDWFGKFNQYKMMDVDGEGKVEIKTFKNARSDLQLPTAVEKWPNAKLFKDIDRNEDEYLSLYEFLQLFERNKEEDGKIANKEIKKKK